MLTVFIVSRNLVPSVAMAILYYHIWSYKFTLKFGAKIKE